MTRRGSGLVCALALMLSSAASAETVVRLGTLAPKGSPWHDAIMQINTDWQRITGGEVTIKVYSGVLGSEPEMLRKMRLKEIHAVALSGAGLSGVTRHVAALQIPLMFDSYAELDYVRDKVAPEIEALIEDEQKLKVLNWSDAGWVHTFATEPVRSPDELRRIRLMCAAGDPDTEGLYKQFGYRVVPLPYTDVLVSLETGLIQAVQGPPLYALLEQWFSIANKMIDVKWAPLLGATLIRMDTWERFEPEWREAMMVAARRAGMELRSTIRQLGDDAVPEMEVRGLNVVRLSPAERLVWQQEVEGVYPTLRGSFTPAAVFDEVLRLRNEYRDANSGE